LAIGVAAVQGYCTQLAVQEEGWPEDCGLNKSLSKTDSRHQELSAEQVRICTEETCRVRLWSLWRELATQYTSRDPTFPVDTIAGLAKRFLAANAGEYAYGMWMECIEEDLLWQNNGYGDVEFRPRKAPSSSWLSAVDDGIQMSGLATLGFKVIRLIDYPQDDVDKVSDGLGQRVILLRGNPVLISLHEEEIKNGMSTTNNGIWVYLGNERDYDSVTPSPASTQCPVKIRILRR
jgi:hypothetical protein